MKAYLIYHREEAVRNRAFISLFEEAGKEYGIVFSYVPYDAYKVRELPDFVLNRTRDSEVSRWYEKAGIPVFHQSRITEIGNHKWKTLTFLKERLPAKWLKRKWAPETVFLPKEKLVRWQAALEAGEEGWLTEPGRFFSLPASMWEEGKSFVLKSVDGHGGSEVMEILPEVKNRQIGEDEQYRTNLCNMLRELSGKDCILQEMIPSDSRDVRVYVLGNQVYQGMLRQGRGDFRSNFSLGGKVEAYSLSEEESEFVQAVLEAFRGEVLGLAGLDFIVAEDGSLVFNELEEMVGCRMLYQYTGRNIVKDYVVWLRNF